MAENASTAPSGKETKDPTPPPSLVDNALDMVLSAAAVDTEYGKQFSDIWNAMSPEQQHCVERIMSATMLKALETLLNEGVESLAACTAKFVSKAVEPITDLVKGTSKSPLGQEQVYAAFSALKDAVSVGGHDSFARLAIDAVRLKRVSAVVVPAASTVAAAAVAALDR